MRVIKSEESLLGVLFLSIVIKSDICLVISLSGRMSAYPILPFSFSIYAHPFPNRSLSVSVSVFSTKSVLFKQNLVGIEIKRLFLLFIQDWMDWVFYKEGFQSIKS